MNNTLVQENEDLAKIRQIHPTEEEIKNNVSYDILIFFNKKGERFCTRLKGMFARGAFGRCSLVNQDLKGLKVDEITEFHPFNITLSKEFFYL